MMQAAGRIRADIARAHAALTDGAEGAMLRRPALAGRCAQTTPRAQLDARFPRWAGR